ncbi:hypothetical protein Q7P37_008854 [Cladosporium fusiforme]
MAANICGGAVTHALLATFSTSQRDILFHDNKITPPFADRDRTTSSFILGEQQRHDTNLPNSDTMVQFAELPMYGQQYYSWYVFRKDYWKIGIGYGTIQRLIERLERRGYRCNRTMNRQRALYLHSRAERGLMFYDKLTKHELQMFCHDRKLLTSKATKNDLKHELERADETATFDHFTKLPPNFD